VFQPASCCIASRRPSPRPRRDAARDAEHERLDEELEHDVATSCAERLAHADLARPLRDRDQHDVHDADAADEQRDRRDAGEQEAERLRGLLERLEQRRLVAHVEVARLAGPHRCSRRSARSISPIAASIAFALEACT
jgi:signal transduction histidine kinase